MLFRSPKKEIVELSPFTVNSARDNGFVAATALTGGRLITDLRDTPAAYSVLTRDFIEALNLTNRDNFGLPSGNLRAATFGMPTALATGATPRQVEIGFRLNF